MIDCAAIKTFTLLILFALFQTPLTNKDVVDLVKAGLGPEVVAAKIRTSQTDFDTSPDALKALKREGVPDAVILAMLDPKTPAARPEPAKRRVAFAEVKRIYVGPMGNSDDAERFRMLLKDELGDKGFAVVEKESDADAVLTGVLATQLSQGTTRARASVTLKGPDGETLWSDSFGVRMSFGLGRRDNVKQRAGDVADGLHDAWKKVQKTRP